MGREVRLLEFLGQHLTTPVPRPLLVGSMNRPRGWPFMAYEKLPGEPLADVEALSRDEQRRLTKFLLTLFTELSECPAAPLTRLGLSSARKDAWPDRFRRLERRYRGVATGRIPAPMDRKIRELFEGFFNTMSGSRFRPCLIHGDLWPSHILWSRERGRPVGVIDWEDARFGDPAFDLGALGGLAPIFGRELIRRCNAGHDDRFEQRLLFYRRILPLQGLLFGLETRRGTLFRRHLRELRASLELESL
jgi:aminoglycoside 2''-phosphotransferase